MNARNFFKLEPILVGNKKIYPISLLKIIIINDILFNIDYEVSALKIIENKEIYYKNVNLSQKDFEYVQNLF